MEERAARSRGAHPRTHARARPSSLARARSSARAAASRCSPSTAARRWASKSEALAEGAQIVSGTPGRVLDHIRRGTLDTSAVRIFVLDEADEMLSMGFAKELHAIADALPKDRQGLFFSATIPPDIERLAIKQLREPEFITLSTTRSARSRSPTSSTSSGPGVDRRRELVRILDVEDRERRHLLQHPRRDRRVAEALQNQGYDADWLNSDLEQKERERVMARARARASSASSSPPTSPRAASTSRTSRTSINYDFPEAAESYVHRTGRTGRAGRTAISLVASRDVGKLYLLRLTYKLRPIEKQLPTPTELKTRSEMDLVQTFVDAFGEREVHPDDRALARRLLTHASAETIIGALLREHLGARPNAPREASEARRAKNPPPVVAVNVADAVAPTLPTARIASEIRDSGAAARSQADAPRRERSADRDRDRDRGPRPRRIRPDMATMPAPPPELPGFSEMPGFTDTPMPVVTEAGPSRDVSSDPSYARIFVNVGRRDGARPGDLQKLLTEGGGIDRADTGEIHVRDRMTFISVKRELLDKAIGALSGQVIGGRTVNAEPARERAPAP
ncbi:MAG: DEAD/DEAH box helicase [Polyangiaceae bacterium]